MKLHVRLAVPAPVTPPGVIVQAVLFVERLTTPEKPSSAVTVRVEVPGEPALTVTEVGLAEIEKSCTVKVTVIE